MGMFAFPTLIFMQSWALRSGTAISSTTARGAGKGCGRATLKRVIHKLLFVNLQLTHFLMPKLHCHETQQTRYLALGGQISRFQWELIDGVIKKYRLKSIRVVLAFDNDAAGKRYVQQFQERYSGSSFNLRLPPREGLDWNDVLQEQSSRKMSR